MLTVSPLHVLISTHGHQKIIKQNDFLNKTFIEFIDLSRNQINYIEKESFSNLAYLQVSKTKCYNILGLLYSILYSY